MQAKWLAFPCSCNETFITEGPGRERAWSVRKHQEERRKPGILKRWHSSRKRCIHATVLPCIFDDLRSIQHCFIFLWVLECPCPNFSRHGNVWGAHGCAELGRWHLGRRDEQHLSEIGTKMSVEDNTDMKRKQATLQGYWLPVVKTVCKGWALRCAANVLCPRSFAGLWIRFFHTV